MCIQKNRKTVRNSSDPSTTKLPGLQLDGIKHPPNCQSKPSHPPNKNKGACGVSPLGLMFTLSGGSSANLCQCGFSEKRRGVGAAAGGAAAAPAARTGNLDDDYCC